MIDFQEDPDPRDRVALADQPRRRHGGTRLPAIGAMFDDLDDLGWNEENLWKCHRQSLERLCLIMGVPKSGTLETLITRLLAIRSVHMKLLPFGTGQQEAVAARFNRDEIRWMCKEARLPRSLGKKTMAWLLLAWRGAIKIAGPEFFNHLKNGTEKEWLPPRQRVQPLIRRLYAIIEHRRKERP